jgi:hypothetical protein
MIFKKLSHQVTQRWFDKLYKIVSSLCVVWGFFVFCTSVWTWFAKFPSLKDPHTIALIGMIISFIPWFFLKSLYRIVLDVCYRGSQFQDLKE